MEAENDRTRDNSLNCFGEQMTSNRTSKMYSRSNISGWTPMNYEDENEDANAVQCPHNSEMDSSDQSRPDTGNSALSGV